MHSDTWKAFSLQTRMLTWREEEEEEGRKKHTQKANANDTLGSSEPRGRGEKQEREALSFTLMLKLLPEFSDRKYNIIILRKGVLFLRSYLLYGSIKNGPRSTQRKKSCTNILLTILTSVLQGVQQLVWQI